MWIFFAAGSLYLIGVAVVLVLKPRWMFTPEGAWKEFGIGQREDRYTPFPFWMFCLVWALVAYGLTLAVDSWMGSRNSTIDVQEEVETSFELPVKNTIRRNNNGRRSNANKPVELPKGYYVLDRKATSLSGVPKYVYLGAEEPMGGIDSTARSLDSE
jgi:hypothetical protein